MKFICKKCKSTNLEITKKGPHQKLICVDCGTFQKFLTKADTRLFYKVIQIRKDKSAQSKISKIIIKPKNRINPLNKIRETKFTKKEEKVKVLAEALAHELYIFDE